jgi:hypothetical protein
MTESLTLAGYQQTKAKFAEMEQRLARLDRQSGLSHQHLSEARRSYEQMMSQYRREIKLYEASHPEAAIKQ